MNPLYCSSAVKIPSKILLVCSIIILAILVLVNTKKLSQQPVGREGEQVRAPNFVDSTPQHGEIYAAAPVNITVNLNQDIVPGSKISVLDANRAQWAEGEVLIEGTNTILKRGLRPGMSDGNYIVNYTTCRTDGACHDGQFKFSIDSSGKSEYQDLRGQSEVTVKMRDLKFDAAKIIISSATRVTWINEDADGHYVNTQTHPGHTYFPIQNSSEIKSGESFEAIFVTVGQYNYHCSRHYPEMVGSIIVSR